MANYKFMLLKYNIGKGGRTSVTLRITKDRKRKYIRTGMSASPEQWNRELDRFIADKKSVPRYREYNAKLAELETRVNAVLRDFEAERVDWTLNQFENAFVGKTAKGNVRDYFCQVIETLKDTGHIGNSICYRRTLHMLELYDSGFGNKVFPEIDIRYVKAFDVFLQKRGCKGNTRKYYFKALRAILNKAIQDREASEATYPFGKGGFNVAALEEETARRYLPYDSMMKIKSTALENTILESTRRLFLFSYYCYGISFIDAALLTKKNIIRYNGGAYIVYKRNKTKESRRARPLQVKITPEIQEHLDWFHSNVLPVEDYLLPVVSIAGYRGERLYNHIRSRFVRNNRNLKRLAHALDITDMKLTSYVARHTVAMTLQDNRVPREVISQILGHSDLSVTNTYLDSFSNSIIDEAAKVL